MKNFGILFGLAGFIVGSLVTLAVIRFSAESLMLNEISVDQDFEEAVELMEQSILAHGWTIPAVHNLQVSMKNFGKDVNKVKVFEICNPEHAYKILGRDDERVVSSLMPCRISVYEKSDGRVYVSWMNLGLVGRMMKGVVPEVMRDAAYENEQIVKALLEQPPAPITHQ